MIVRNEMCYERIKRERGVMQTLALVSESNINEHSKRGMRRSPDSFLLGTINRDGMYEA